jgi:hypothetical protein
MHRQTIAGETGSLLKDNSTIKFGPRSPSGFLVPKPGGVGQIAIVSPPNDCSLLNQALYSVGVCGRFGLEHPEWSETRSTASTPNISQTPTVDGRQAWHNSIARMEPVPAIASIVILKSLGSTPRMRGV